MLNLDEACLKMTRGHAHELPHWDMQQRHALCQDISSMTNLTLLDLSNELDNDCQRHLVTSLEEMSNQEIKMQNLEGACLKMTTKVSYS